MAELTTDQILSVKQKGFLRNRGTDKFSGRIVPAGCVFSAKDLETIAEISKTYGNGKIVFTSRLNAEIVDIPYEKIESAIQFAKEHDLLFGGTGAEIRPVTACKGTTCIYGNFDTQGLAKEIYDRYYLGWSHVKLPHKFKIGIGGCPNSCMKPSLNDFGIQGQRTLNHEFNDPNGQFRIFVGGTFGKKNRIGTPLPRLVERKEIFPFLEKTILWFRENAYYKERLGAAIDRIGIEKFEEELFSEDLLLRKEEILAADLKVR